MCAPVDRQFSCHSHTSDMRRRSASSAKRMAIIQLSKDSHLDANSRGPRSDRCLLLCVRSPGHSRWQNKTPARELAEAKVWCRGLVRAAARMSCGQIEANGHSGGRTWAISGIRLDATESCCRCCWLDCVRQANDILHLALQHFVIMKLKRPLARRAQFPPKSKAETLIAAERATADRPIPHGQSDRKSPPPTAPAGRRPRPINRIELPLASMQMRAARKQELGLAKLWRNYLPVLAGHKWRWRAPVAQRVSLVSRVGGLVCQQSAISARATNSLSPLLFCCHRCCCC